jgi:hypothetical protein
MFFLSSFFSSSKNEGLKGKGVKKEVIRDIMRYLETGEKEDETKKKKKIKKGKSPKVHIPSPFSFPRTCISARFIFPSLCHSTRFIFPRALPLYLSMHFTFPCALPFHALYLSMRFTFPCALPFHALYLSMRFTFPCALPFHALYLSMRLTFPRALYVSARALRFHTLYHSTHVTLPLFTLCAVLCLYTRLPRAFRSTRFYFEHIFCLRVCSSFLPVKKSEW